MHILFTQSFISRPPVSLTMALSPARYGPGLLHPVPPPPILNREPTPKQDNSDNDGNFCLIFAARFVKDLNLFFCMYEGSAYLRRLNCSVTSCH